MPARKFPLITGEYYHVFNRSQNKQPIFVRKRDCERAIGTIKYYRTISPPTRFSHFLSFGPDKRSLIEAEMENSNSLVKLISFTLMPNHFHFLLKQVEDGGISKFISLFQNSFTKYLNTKYSQEGHVVKGQFKAIRIEDDEQLLHLHRYIHLNPYASFVVKSLEDLVNYPYSSLREYLGIEKGFCEKGVILSRFQSIKNYKKFILDQADYQRNLEKVKHLALD